LIKQIFEILPRPDKHRLEQLNKLTEIPNGRLRNRHVTFLGPKTVDRLTELLVEVEGQGLGLAVALTCARTRGEVCRGGVHVCPAA